MRTGRPGASNTHSPLLFQIEKLVPQPQEAVAFGLMHTERRADQVVDEIDLRARQERHRGRIDQHHRAIALDHQIVLGPGVLDVELVLEAGAAATLDGDAQHGAVAFGLEDFARCGGQPAR